MAEIIQGQLNVVHRLEKKEPTGSGNPTAVGSQETNFKGKEEDINKDDVATKGARKMLGTTSIYRRLANYTIAGGERMMNRNFDEKLFRESLYGDKRSIKKIQNQKTLYNGMTNYVKSVTGSLVTSIALKNPAIVLLQMSNMLLMEGDKFLQQQTERRQFEGRSSIETYESNRRRERVIVGTYNRR